MAQHPILLFTIFVMLASLPDRCCECLCSRRGTRNGLSHNTYGRKMFRLPVRVGLKDSFRQ
jgi:hypothetical protein